MENCLFLIANEVKKLRKEFIDNHAYKVAILSSEEYVAANYEKSKCYLEVLSASYVDLVHKLGKLSDGVEFLGKLYDYQSKG